MAFKGLVPFRPKLSTYPYNSDIVKKETTSTASDISPRLCDSNPDVAMSSPSSSSSTTSLSNASNASNAVMASHQVATMKESLQPLSSQAPVIGEKYYFSKSPISNDVAKAAAATVMAIASSAINAAASVTNNKNATSIAKDSKPIGKEI